MKVTMFSLLCLLATSSTFAAPRGRGPVADKCKTEIEKLCKGKAHVNREVRTCLEENKDQLSDPCKEALETTGPGKGGGRNRP